jgi:hypothetical protein
VETKPGVKIIPEAKPVTQGTTVHGQTNIGVKIVSAGQKDEKSDEPTS